MNISSGDHAVFNCTAIATFINWEVNGTTVDAEFLSKGFETQQLVDPDNNLTVLGTTENNGSFITCHSLLLLTSPPSSANSTVAISVKRPGMLVNSRDI